jgi:hypothetical protein
MRIFATHHHDHLHLHHHHQYHHYQQEVEAREDMLTFTTPVLSGDLAITGPIFAELFVSSDAVDTDFMVDPPSLVTLTACPFYPHPHLPNVAVLLFSIFLPSFHTHPPFLPSFLPPICRS